MLETFTRKSKNKLKGVRIDKNIIEKTWKEKKAPNGIREICPSNPTPDSAFANTLARSSNTLKFYSHHPVSDPYPAEVFSDLAHITEFPKLEVYSSFSPYLPNRTSFRIRETRSPSLIESSTAENLILSQIVMWTSKKFHLIAPILLKSSTTLKFLSLLMENLPGSRTNSSSDQIDHPNLQVLEFAGCHFGFPEWFSTPNLRVARLTSNGSIDVPEDLPLSLKSLWLGKAWYATSNPKMTINRFMELRHSAPELEELRIDLETTFIPRTILWMLNARRVYSDMGMGVEGVEMKTIEKLTINTETFVAENLTSLQGLVEELVNTRGAPETMMIDI